MATINTFEELHVWQKARLLCKRIFALSASGRFQRDYSLIDQINRSAGSIMDNIAEGFGRNGSREFVNFLTYSNGSAYECKSQLQRAYDRNYLTLAELTELLLYIQEIIKMNYGLISYLNKTDIKGLKFKFRT